MSTATANSATLADSATLGTPITPDALAPMLDTPATVEESNQASTSEIIILDDEEADDDESMADATEDDYVEDKSAAAGKRKAKDSKSATKKAKVSTAATKEKKPKASATKDKKEKAVKIEDAPVLVELKNNKFTLKQKPISSDILVSTLKARLAFSEYCTKLAEDSTHTSSFLDDLPTEHLAVIARLVHESDKTLAALTTAVQKTLIEYISATLLIDEDSQDVEPKTALTARFPVASISSLIQEIATRVDYGLDFDDVPDDIRAGVTEIPASLQLFRWEIDDSALLPSELEGKFAKRKIEREDARTKCKELFLALPDAEQTTLLSHVGPKKGRPSLAAIAKREANGGADDGADGPVASGSGSTKAKEPKVKVKKEKKVQSDDEEVAALKAEKAAEKARKKLENDAKAAIRDEKRAKKAAEDAEKEAIKTKKANELKASSNMLTGFFTKGYAKSASPAPVSSFAKSSPHTKSGAVADRRSEFDKAFLEFFVRSDVRVAPVNQFEFIAAHLRKTGDDFEVQMDSDISREKSLDEFRIQLATANIRLPTFVARLSRLEGSDSVAAVSEVQKIFEAQQLGDPDQKAEELAKLADRKRFVQKLLIFREDARPGYLGTWTKHSSIIRPRNPLATDNDLLQYDYDSEGDWNEEDDAEDVGSGGDESADEDDASDMDSDNWLAGDNEVVEFEDGHMDDSDSDEEPDILFDGESVDDAKRRIREQRMKASREAQQSRGVGKVLGSLVPVIKGPAWEKKIGLVSQIGFEPMRIRFLNDATTGINPFKFIAATRSFQLDKKLDGVAKGVVATPNGAKASADTPSTGSAVAVAAKPKSKAKPIPAELMSRFVRLIHGATEAKPQLRDKIHAAFTGEKGVSKAGIDVSFQQVGSKKGKDGVWFIEESVLALYPLVDGDKMEID